MPDCCIGVDVITGFPGETEEDFLTTYNFLKDLDISYLHVFTYSERENTVAAEMDEVVPVGIRKERNKRLRILSEKKLRAFYESQVGKNKSVLFEADNKAGYMHGFTDNYVKVRVPYDASLINTIVECIIESINADGEAEVSVLLNEMVQ
jgi:threonylcarbamoyladenosine tRNA methylthiotransferase MtaB